MEGWLCRLREKGSTRMSVSDTTTSVTCQHNTFLSPLTQSLFPQPCRWANNALTGHLLARAGTTEDPAAGLNADRSFLNWREEGRKEQTEHGWWQQRPRYNSVADVDDGQGECLSSSQTWSWTVNWSQPSSTFVGNWSTTCSTWHNVEHNAASNKWGCTAY